LREFAPDHVIACHLEKGTLLKMEPVNTVDTAAQALADANSGWPMRRS